MQRTVAGIRRDTRQARLTALAAREPEWRSWLALLELVDDELRTGHWDTAGLQLSTGGDADEPLLHRAVLPVSRRAVTAWIRTLFRAAAARAGGGAPSLMRAERADALELLAAALAHDCARLGRLVDLPEHETAAITATAQLAVMPLLHACCAAIQDRIPQNWGQGSCPVCGAWPTLAELRGLERARVLRCARCGSGWRAAVLLCPFCGERYHNRLGSLTPEVENPVHHVEVCNSCSGYVKTSTVLQGVPVAELVLEDLSTIELDLVALERGYARPPEPGCPVHMQLVS
ncbi:MAG: hypothetical protein ACT4O1_10360 [Gemmatimonadota bacterium]